MSARAYNTVTAALERNGMLRRADQWQCPAHDDSTPSLSIADRPDRVLIKCHAGCDTLDVLERLGLGWPDVFDDPAAGKGWTTRTLRRIGAKANGDGRITLGGVRYMPGGKPKSLAAPGAERGLWPDPSTVMGTRLYVVEGEPDAVTATQLGLPAVAVPGTGKWAPEWAAKIAEGR